MMESIFIKFCKYVDESIFPKENRGESIAFIVDQAFIDEFCKKHAVSENALLRDVRLNLNRVSKENHLHVKGVLAIQLYAATKREDTGEISSSNYRERLCQILNLDIYQELKPWMETNQDNFWAAFYSWCRKNDFQIVEYRPSPGPWRYVQYPVQQASRVFTQKDLKTIAYYFVKHNLQPGEDISEHDFWKILWKKSLPNYVYTSHHGRRLVENQDYLPDAYKQVYNFYLRWDGKYLDIESNRYSKVSKEQYFIYLSEEGHIDVRDKYMKLKKQIDWDCFSKSSIETFYSFKRDKIILFRKNEEYEGYWEETRYLERQDKDGKTIFEDGMAVVIMGNNSVYQYSMENPFSHLRPIYANRKIKIYRFQYSHNLAYLYTEKKFFGLEGGLKIGRMQFLLGGAPFLSMSKNSLFWIDGKRPPKGPVDGYLDLNFLSSGSHDIKFPGFKKIEFEIISPELINPSWDESYTKWLFSCKERKWLAAKSEEGIVGLDYSIFKIKGKSETDTGILTRWAQFHLTEKNNTNERNIALKLLNKQ